MTKPKKKAPTPKYKQRMGSTYSVLGSFGDGFLEEVRKEITNEKRSDLRAHKVGEAKSLSSPRST